LNSTPWLEASPGGSTLTPGGPAATASITLAPGASNLLLGTYSATVPILDLASGVRQNLHFDLVVGNGGFETGDFTNWTASLESSVNFVDSSGATQFSGTSNISAVDDSALRDSRTYGGLLGQN